ncbi:MAG: aldo/keto reductase [Anaerolineales bacterium]|jgi:aryl-alcohol dehydrogenase-like predicted oxidoreductase
MQYRNLGRTGVWVSPLCLGAMNFGGPTPEDEAIWIIHKALDAGINFVDTANMYNAGKSEVAVGKALNGSRREKTILATKFHFPQSDDPNDQGNSRRHIMQAVEDSLRRLRTDWIDLYQIHRSTVDVPQDETLRALDDLVRQGKVRYIGSSTFPAWMVMEALSISERYGLARLVSEQPPYNLLDRRIENELVPLAQRYNLGLLPWSPLAMGILAGRYRSTENLPKDSRLGSRGSKWMLERLNKRSISTAQKFAAIAKTGGYKPAQLALLWVRDQPAVTAPIIGPRREAHLDEALAIADETLDEETASRLDELVPPGSAVADFHNTSRWMKMKI